MVVGDRALLPTCYAKDTSNYQQFLSSPPSHTSSKFLAVYLEERVQQLPEPLRTSCLGALKIMRASQNPNGIDGNAISIKSQDFTTPLTLYNVNGNSPLTSIEGEPFSPAELAAIFALSKAQATMQAAMSARHSGEVISYEIASAATVSQTIWSPSHLRNPQPSTYTGCGRSR